MHKSGFVNIIGRPNVGKSTLMNALVGERMSIITSKPQTTRHRIIGILSDDDFQIVFSDTPGVIEKPQYQMQQSMNRFVWETFEDADIMLFVIDVYEEMPDSLPIYEKLNRLEVPLYLVLNKIDLTDEATIQEKIKAWGEKLNFKKVFQISALNKIGTDELLKDLVETLPEGPEYYPKDQLTDKPERFFVAEIIREKILLNYKQEIPYSVEIIVESFKEDPEKPLIRIRAEIYVMRESQKFIIIGSKGDALKKVGTEARKDLEIFLDKKVFLELFVKVRDNWRDDENILKRFGYNS